MTEATVSGEVVLSGLLTTGEIKGDETLKISVIYAPKGDAPSVSLGEEKISLQKGQTFPIKFQASYNPPKAGSDLSHLLVNARIQNPAEKLLYVNATQTPLVDDVIVKVIKA